MDKKTKFEAAKVIARAAKKAGKSAEEIVKNEARKHRSFFGRGALYRTPII